MRCFQCERDWPPKYREHCPRCGSALVHAAGSVKLTIDGVEIKGWMPGKFVEVEGPRTEERIEVKGSRKLIRSRDN